MKKIIFSLSVFAASFATAQTGINTTAPNTTLEVVAKNTDGTTPEGVKTPQLTGDAVKAMTANLTAAQNGNIVYVTTPVTTTDAATANMTYPGHYRFNFDAATSTKSWIRLEPSGLEKIANTLEPTNRSYDYWKLIGENVGRTNTVGSQGLNIDMALGGELFVNNPASESYSNNVGTDGFYNIAIGAGAYAKGTGTVALGGFGAQALAATAIAIGSGSDTLPSRAKGESSLAINGGLAAGANSIAIGTLSLAYGPETTFAIGAASQAKDAGAIAFGIDSNANGVEALAIGYESTAIGNNSIAITGKATGVGAISLGSDSEANGMYTMALGAGSKATDSIPVVIGTYSVLNKITMSNIGNWGILPTTISPSEKFDVNGDIRIRGNHSTDYTFTGAGGACTNPGTITYQNDTFYGCKTTGWVQLNN